MWKRLLMADLIDSQPVNNVLKIRGGVIHIIHGFLHRSYLSTNCQQDFNVHFHKLIHALIVYNEGVDLNIFKPFECGQSVH